MPNARDLHETEPPKILVLGEPGAGKTTQFLTLPGRKFLYVFDPNARRTFRGHDLEYEEFLPDKLPVNLQSLKSAEKGGRSDRSNLRDTQSTTYLKWEEHFERACESGWFGKNFDWVGFDSLTSFGELVMDRVLTLNNRAGDWPQQDDYGPQMNAISKTFRMLTSQNVGVYCTGHIDIVQDEITKKIYVQPLTTGKLRKRLPILFSEILFLEGLQDNVTKKGKYTMNTVPTSTMPITRTSLRNVEARQDITIDFTKPVVGQGLGRWFHVHKEGASQ